MKKCIFALLVFMLASPVMAENVVITVVDDGNGIASINYSTDVDVRAFALIVDINGPFGANILEVNDYFKKGDCNATDKGYGIFLDQINGIKIDDDEVDEWGSPVADATSPGAGGTGIGTDKVILGMGALYEDGNKPSSSGTLCKIKVGNDCNVWVFEEDTYRGGVVLADGNGTDANLTGAQGVPVTGIECYEGMDDYSEWEEVGKPACWCYLRQCHGDADGKAQGSARFGYTYVDTDDLAIMAAGWQVKDPPKGSGILGLTVNGVPVACADFAHNKQGSARFGYTRIDTDDLALMAAYWQVKEPTKGSGTPYDCTPGNRMP